MTLRTVLAATLIVLAGMACEANAQDVTLPRTLAWCAYDVGSSGDDQAVAIRAAFSSR